jgi:hypothetical protein
MTHEEATKLTEQVLREYPDVLGTMARRVLEEHSKPVADILDSITAMDNGIIRFDVRIHRGRVTDTVVSKSDRIIYK